MQQTARLLWCAAAIGGVFGLWLVVGGSAQAGLAFLYTVPIGLTTWWFGWRSGLAAALACIGLFVLGSTFHEVADFGLAVAIRSLAFLAVVVLVAVARKRISVLEHSAEELEAIRHALTPPSMPDLIGADLAAAFVPSELGVSGDFYLATNGPDGSTIAIVGDVVGHGPKAARLATFIRAQLAVFAASTSDPAEILTLANRALEERQESRSDLVSAVCLRLAAESGELSWAVAGHPPPLRLPELGSLEPSGTTFLLGAKSDLELSTAETSLQLGDGVLVYTDGATDLRRRRDQLLGLDGLRHLLRPLVDLPAPRLAAELERALVAWSDETIRDDLCVLVLRPKTA